MADLDTSLLEHETLERLMDQQVVGRPLTSLNDLDIDKLMGAIYKWVGDTNVELAAISGGGGSGGMAVASTRQVLTSGTGATYVTPAGVVKLSIRMVGGGGGGGGWSDYGDAGDGADGSPTIFNSVYANGGGGGHNNLDFGYAPPGGTGGAGVASFRTPGAPGSSTIAGGSSLLGGGGTGTGQGVAPGNPAPPNTGGGGAPGGSNGGIGYSSGGGSGEYVELIIDNPASSYIFTIGQGGAGGTPGTRNAGGAGGSGVIIVDEYYSSANSGLATLKVTKTYLDFQAGELLAPTDAKLNLCVLPSNAIIVNLIAKHTEQFTGGGATLTNVYVGDVDFSGSNISLVYSGALNFTTETPAPNKYNQMTGGSRSLNIGATTQLTTVLASNAVPIADLTAGSVDYSISYLLP